MTRLNSNTLTSRKETGKKIILPLIPHTVKVIKNWLRRPKRSKNRGENCTSIKTRSSTNHISQIHCCVNQSKENHGTLHRICFPEKAGTMLQKAIREDSLSPLNFSILKTRVLVMWAPSLVAGQRLLRLKSEGKIISCFSLLINCGEVWRITPASVRWGSLEGKVDPRDRTQIYQQL